MSHSGGTASFAFQGLQERPDGFALPDRGLFPNSALIQDSFIEI